MGSEQRSPMQEAISPVERSNRDNESTQSQQSYIARSHKRHKSLDLSTITHPEPHITPFARSESSETKVGIDENLPILESPPSNNKDVKSPDRVQSNVAKPHITKDSLDELLGISLDSWPYSENILSSTISLKAEMERTKREEIKLATVNQSIELLKLAILANVPSHLIPSVFAANGLKEPFNLESYKDQDPQQSSKLHSRHATSTSVFKVNMPQQQQFQFHHWQKPDGSIQRPDVSSTGSTVGTSSAGNLQVPMTPNRAGEERKRKISVDEESDKPTTPYNIRPHVANHRRNQSEASVSQLRSIYENQIAAQNTQRVPSNNIPPYNSLRSPYVYPAHDNQGIVRQQQQQQQQHVSQRRPNMYQFPAQHPSMTQGSPPPSTPLRGVVPSPHILQQHPPPQQGQRPPPPHFMPGPPQTFHFHPKQPLQPPPPTLEPAQRGYSSTQSSPVSLKSKGKGDVSFLISTPNNPPK